MKRLSLINEFEEIYKGSDLQKIVQNNPIPIKYTINGFDCYFYNADLFGLFDWRVQKEGFSTDDFIIDYKKGFEKGMQHLKKVEKIKLKDLKSKDLKEDTITQLKNILHEREFKFGSKGLLDLVFNKVPLVFTEKTIFDCGYWNAIIFSIDDLCEKAGLTPDELNITSDQPIDEYKIETDKPDETKKELHSDIFKGNAFELFRKYYTEEELGPSSRTDLNLLFQLFERYNLFVETVELKHYIRWLNKNGYYEDVELKKVDINSRPNRQRKNAFKRYASDLKITLK